MPNFAPVQKNKNLGAKVEVDAAGKLPLVLTLHGLTSSGSLDSGRIRVSNNRVAVQNKFGTRECDSN